MKKISFTRFKIIGVKILESCKNLQIYLKFDHKSQCRTWIVLLDIRDWWIFHPWKKWFMKISFNWLLYTYLPQFLSYTFFLQIAQISDNYLFSYQVVSYRENTCADPGYFYRGMRQIFICDLSYFECLIAAGGMSGLPDTPSRFAHGRKNVGI